MSRDMQGILGKKIGMTQVLDGDGNLVPVTVIEAGPCVIIQKKSYSDGSRAAVQVAFCECPEHRLSKSERERFKKIGVKTHKYLREFNLDVNEECKEGDVVTASLFEGVGYVDVTSVSKGRGFQGVMRKFRMRGGAMTHGGHAKRRPGAIGQNSYPANVDKGKKLPGQMGNVKVTTQNLQVVAVHAKDNVLLVRGAIPGHSGAIVEIRKALKKTGVKS